MNAKTQLASLEDVGLAIGEAVILTRAKFTLDAGEKVGLIGPNGSGKTTLLRVLATLLRPTSGHGMVLGADLASDEVYRIRPGIVLIGHLPGLYPELTLAENSRFVARLRGKDVELADQALATVGLAGAAERRADHSRWLPGQRE